MNQNKPAPGHRRHQNLCAGVDEAGRGPLAGPVVVSAVVLDPTKRIQGLKDSKQLTAKRREVLAPRIKQKALAWAVVYVDANTVDELNILQATLCGMTRSVELLGLIPDEVFVDGNRVPELTVPATAIVAGDSKVRAISAASILAKTARDAYMEKLDPKYPEFGFAQHKGYPTREHLEILRRLGPTPEHRRSFAPVRNVAQGDLWAATPA